MDVVDALLDHLMNTKYEALPRDVVDTAQRHLIDYISVLIAGSSMNYVHKLLEVFENEGGKPESRVALEGKKMPVVSAAAVNATLGRVHDIDDVHEEAVAHIGVGVIPAVLCGAEKEALSGRELLSYITLGYDIAARFCLGALIPPGKSGMNIGYHAATLVSALLYGKITGLNVQELRQAAGIAFCEMSGTDQCLLEGSAIVAVQQGLSCAKGIRAAQLAEAGITGPREFLFGPFGYYNTYQHGKYAVDPIVKDLGSVFQGTKVSTKLYPCCKFAHSAVEGWFEISRGKSFEAEDIKEVTVHVSKQAYTFICHPIEVRRVPKSVVEAKFSLPYILATAIRQNKVWIDDFSEQAIADPKTLSVAAKINPIINEKIEAEHGNIIGPCMLEVIFADGSRKSAMVTYVRGHPQKPLTDAEIRGKLDRCLAVSNTAYSEGEKNELFHILWNVPDMSDVRTLLSAMYKEGKTHTG